MMDELLDFMEEELEDGSPESRDLDTPKCPGSPLKHRNSHSSTSSREKGKLSSSSKTTKSRNDLTFDDVFGSPDKRDIKEFGLTPSRLQSSSSSRPSKDLNIDRKSFSSSITASSSYPSNKTSSSSDTPPALPTNQLELRKAIRLDDNVPYKPDTSMMVIDPFSRVRIFKNSLTIYFDESVTAETVLKDRNIGLEFVPMSTFNGWYKSKGKDVKNFWISGVLVKKSPGVRKSAKGNDYAIWELSDLKDLDKKVTIFLFGSSSSSLSATPLGSLVDMTTPSVLQDSSTSSGGIKFSINNASQVRFIATSKDFGFCQSRKKDGNKCTAVVNTWECSFCIYHTSAELKKLNIGKSKKSTGKVRGKEKGGLFPNRSFNEGSESLESLKQQGITISSFGGSGNLNKTLGFGSKPSVASSSKPALPSRMALQGSSVEMKKNPIKFGNPETVKFIENERNHPLLKKDEVNCPLSLRKPLDLNPSKTRHLSDRDRELLQRLETKSTGGTINKNKPAATENKESSQSKISIHNVGEVSSFITSAIASNPNAASRNFMQFLQLQNAPKDQVDLSSGNKSTDREPITMSRAKVKSMQKALAFVKQNGPIRKSDPNDVTGRKRKFQQMSQNEEGGSRESSSSFQQGPNSKKRTSTSGSSAKIDVEFDFESEEFKRILNAKSAHDDELDVIQHEEYFGKLEKKEALENKLLNTYSIETNAVMCRQCKYVALGQSDFCKELMHKVRVVKARKRFFKCKDCGNRTMSLDRLPKRACANCNNSSWLVAPVGKERKGPTLPSEMLAVRGHEEKFIGTAGSKMYLHLEV